MRLLVIPLAVALLLLASGCQSAMSTNSVSFVGFPCNVITAPLAGDFGKCSDLKNLKKGTSSDVIFFQYYLPIASVGDESIQSAMRNGGLKEVYYVDYSSRFFLIVGWYTINAYGK